MQVFTNLKLSWYKLSSIKTVTLQTHDTFEYKYIWILSYQKNKMLIPV